MLLSSKILAEFNFRSDFFSVFISFEVFQSIKTFND